jgi:hypothetical protein
MPKAGANCSFTAPGRLGFVHPGTAGAHDGVNVNDSRIMTEITVTIVEVVGRTGCFNWQSSRFARVSILARDRDADNDPSTMSSAVSTRAQIRYPPRGQVGARILDLPRFCGCFRKRVKRKMASPTPAGSFISHVPARTLRRRRRRVGRPRRRGRRGLEARARDRGRCRRRQHARPAAGLLRASDPLGRPTPSRGHRIANHTFRAIVPSLRRVSPLLALLVSPTPAGLLFQLGSPGGARPPPPPASRPTPRTTVRAHPMNAAAHAVNAT